MSEKSNIEWTATVHADGSVTPGATWNPSTGCSQISPGCAHCYIERTTPFRVKGRQFVKGVIPIQLHENRLEAPMRWKKPKRIFVNSLSDLFHDDIPAAFIARVFAVMGLASWHTFQVLTKRPERMHALLNDENFRANVSYQTCEALRAWKFGTDPITDADVMSIGLTAKKLLTTSLNGGVSFPNIWLGVSVENQHFADERIGLLLATPAAVRFISAEPLLAPITLEDPVTGESWLRLGRRAVSGTRLIAGPTLAFVVRPPLDWIIIGGESGPGARPFEVAWARAILEQCRLSRVPCFVKQLGAHPVFPDGGGWEWRPTDKKGSDPAEWPEDIRVREFPIAAPAPTLV